MRAHSNEALELSNRLSLLKKRLQLLQQGAAALEAQQDYSLQVAAQKTLEYGQVQWRGWAGTGGGGAARAVAEQAWGRAVRVLPTRCC